MEQYYRTCVSLPLPLSIFFLIVSSILLWYFLFKSRGSSTSLASRALLFRLLFARGYFHDIMPLLRRLRDRYGPVITIGFGPMSVTWVMDRRIAQRALVQDGFNDRRQVNDASVFVMLYSQWRVVGSATGKLWGVLRRNLVLKAFRRSNLRAFASKRRLAAEQLVAELRAQRQEGFPFAVTFERAFSRLMLYMCFGEQLDVSLARPLAESKPTIPLGVKLCFFTRMPDITKLVFWRKWRRFLQGRRRFEETVFPFLKARRERAAAEQRGEDAALSYVDTLLELEIPDGEEGRARKLSDKEISNLCMEFMALGVESIVCLMEWVMANLILHPQVQQRLYVDIVAAAPPGREIDEEEDMAKIPYLRAVIMETLRLHPPITIPFSRAAMKRASVEGHTFEKGRMVLFDVMDVGRDEAVWEEPRAFKPERFLEGGEGEGVDVTGSKEVKMVPFGMGRRLCPAMDLTMLNLEYFLACLVRGFEWEAPRHHDDGRANVDMTARIDVVGAMKNPLHARASPRQ